MAGLLVYFKSAILTLKSIKRFGSEGRQEIQCELHAPVGGYSAYLTKQNNVDIKFTAADSVADGRPSCLFQIRHFNTGNLSNTSAPRVGKICGANCTIRPVDIAPI